MVTYAEAHTVGTMVTQNHWEAEHFVTFDFIPGFLISLHIVLGCAGVCVWRQSSDVWKAGNEHPDKN